MINFNDVTKENIKEHEIDVMKFRDNTMVCGCTTKKNFNL